MPFPYLVLTDFVHLTLRHIAIAFFIAVAFGMAFALEGYTLYRFTLAGAYAIAILGINLLTGLSGQFSIGHSAFFAVGAYAMALTMQDAGLGPYVGLLAAFVAAFVAGFLFGWPALRLSLVHFAIVMTAACLVWVVGVVFFISEIQKAFSGMGGTVAALIAASS